ncbi:MAG: FAD-dependent monooxygenase, partial [Angustibacter sp.]
TTNFPVKNEFGPFVNISQYDVERTLRDLVANSPLIELRPGAELVHLRQSPTNIVVGLRSGGATGLGRAMEESLSYVIGCDGVKSQVRQLAGIAWVGYTHPGRFLITDIQADIDLPRGRHFYYNPKFNSGRQVIMHPQPEGIWRIDWQLAQNADRAAERRSGAFDERVRAVIGDVPYAVKWLSIYRFQQRLAGRLRSGRILLAGDAAHALPPYGSRGLNSGIADAENLAWRLSRAVHRGDSDGLLENYHRERFAAAQENINITEATLRFMVPAGRLATRRRNFVLRAAHFLPPARRFVNSGQLSTPSHYETVPGGNLADPLIGAFAPDALLDRHCGTWLRSLLGACFTAILSFPTRPELGNFLAELGQSDLEAQLRVIAVQAPSDRENGPPDPAIDPSAVHQVLDRHGNYQEIYARRNSVGWLLRPDGHIAGRFRNMSDLAQLLRAAAVEC